MDVPRCTIWVKWILLFFPESIDISTSYKKWTGALNTSCTSYCTVTQLWILFTGCKLTMWVLFEVRRRLSQNMWKRIQRWLFTLHWLVECIYDYRIVSINWEFDARILSEHLYSAKHAFTHINHHQSVIMNFIRKIQIFIRHTNVFISFG